MTVSDRRRGSCALDLNSVRHGWNFESILRDRLAGVLTWLNIDSVLSVLSVRGSALLK
jgi:hypothetical protein